MTRKDVTQEFIDWAQGDLMMAFHGMAGCIGLARARVDCDRSMVGVPSAARNQLQHDLRMAIGPVKWESTPALNSLGQANHTKTLVEKLAAKETTRD
jgi:hypothetical protein